MKKIFLLLFVTCNTAMAQPSDYKIIAQNVFTQIRNREFDKATVLFDSGFVVRMDSTRLKQSWDKLLTLTGSFVKVLETTQDHQPNYDVILQHLQFEKKKIDFKVVFGTNQKIKGISFLPGEPREGYKLPTYYNKDSIVELKVPIKFGPLALPGYLTAPNRKGKFPLVILIHGTIFLWVLTST